MQDLAEMPLQKTLPPDRRRRRETRSGAALGWCRI